MSEVVRERRRFSVKAPITGLLLVGLVTYGGYWGLQKAFGSADDEAPVASDPDCVETTTPPPSTGLPGTTTTPPATPPATSDAVALVLVAATTPVTPPPTTTPGATPGATTGTSVLRPADVTVNVYNATSRRGLAINTAALLKNFGFTIGEVTNDPLEEVIAEPAKIRASVADAPEVRLLVQYVPGSVVVATGRADSTIDLVLGEGFQSLITDPAVVTPVPVATPRC